MEFGDNVTWKRHHDGLWRWRKMYETANPIGILINTCHTDAKGMPKSISSETLSSAAIPAEDEHCSKRWTLNFNDSNSRFNSRANHIHCLHVYGVPFASRKIWPSILIYWNELWTVVYCVLFSSSSSIFRMQSNCFRCENLIPRSLFNVHQFNIIEFPITMCYRLKDHIIRTQWNRITPPPNNHIWHHNLQRRLPFRISKNSEICKDVPTVTVSLMWMRNVNEK